MNRRTFLLAVPALGAAFALACEVPGRSTVPSTPTPGPTPLPAAPGTPVALVDPTTTSTGVKYQDLAVGTGPSPASNQYVLVHYRGTIAATGSQFDSSYARATKQWLQMSLVIKGFAEGLSTMKVGGRRNIFVPAALGYGAATRPGIPPNSDLVFEVELFEVSDAPPPEPTRTPVPTATPKR